MKGRGIHGDELRVVGGTSGIYALRMLGLYMALPVMATWTNTFPDATPFKVGLAVGAYGLTQAMFQVPFGIWGDVRGRRLVILVSLAVFALGSLVIALARDADQIILGRLIQGVGAMASTLIALIGDHTREEVRTRAMALMGAVLGITFAVGFLFGPLAAARFGVPSVFSLACGLSLLAIVLFELVIPSRLVPHGRPPAHAIRVSWSWRDARALLGNRSLLVLDIGICALHACLTALFVVLPLLLQRSIPDDQLWKVYAPAIGLGIVALFAASHAAENPRRVKPILRTGAVSIALGLVAMAFLHEGFDILLGLTLFVVGFATVEPVLAALVTRYVRRTARGTAAGIFNTVQFFGAFVGGALAGGLLELSPTAPFWGAAAVALVWLVTLGALRDPCELATSRIEAPALCDGDWARVHDTLAAHPGVIDVEWRAGEPVTVRHWARALPPEGVEELVGRAAGPGEEDGPGQAAPPGP